MKFYQEKVEANPKIPARIYRGPDKVGGYRYPLHWHEHLEFDLVLEGKIKARVSGKDFEVVAGEMLFINSGELHETDASDSVGLKTITLLLSNSLLAEYCEDTEQHYFDLSDKPEADKRLQELIIQCSDVQKHRKEFYELEMSIILRQICSILLNECMHKNDEPFYNKRWQKSVQTIKLAISYISKNYDNSFNLRDIATNAGMSPAYFSRFFRNCTGETFYSYLTKYRILCAHRELMNSDNSITEVALNNGFPNVKSFIDSFKKVYTLTPAKYRSRSKSKT